MCTFPRARLIIDKTIVEMATAMWKGSSNNNNTEWHIYKYTPLIFVCSHHILGSSVRSVTENTGLCNKQIRMNKNGDGERVKERKRNNFMHWNTLRDLFAFRIFIRQKKIIYMIFAAHWRLQLNFSCSTSTIFWNCLGFDKMIYLRIQGKH